MSQFNHMALTSHATGRWRLRPHLTNDGTIDWSKFLNRPLFTSNYLDDNDTIARKTVLITGAGGSIGSALSLRLMSSLAGTLVLIDHSQRNLDALYKEYRERDITFPRVEFFPVDILAQEKLQEIFSIHRPHIVFHAAAMKHLPALECAPFMALEHNVMGTLCLLLAADSSDVECFINVSTDKAVNPTSVLGISKRISELLLLAVEPTALRLISLRLGNVLGSSGSVVPRFMRCLENHQPLRITDPHASRYFITQEEVVAFLMNTLAISANSLLLPEMGNQRRIVELAAFLLNEFQSDVPCPPMTFTSLQDGEKRSEQLTYDYEYLADTSIPHLHRICGTTNFDPERFSDNLGRLLERVVKQEKAGFMEALTDIVPEFTPSNTLLRYVL